MRRLQRDQLAALLALTCLQLLQLRGPLAAARLEQFQAADSCAQIVHHIGFGTRQIGQVVQVAGNTIRALSREQ